MKKLRWVMSAILTREIIKIVRPLIQLSSVPLNQSESKRNVDFVYGIDLVWYFFSLSFV